MSELAVSELAASESAATTREGTQVATAEERMRILNLVEEGRVSAEEAARLLGAMGEREAPPQEPMHEMAAGAGGRWLRIRVTDTYSGHTKVRVSLPLAVVNAALKLGGRFVPELHDVDLAEIRQLIESGATGKLVEVDDEEDGEKVEIFVE